MERREFLKLPALAAFNEPKRGFEVVHVLTGESEVLRQRLNGQFPDAHRAVIDGWTIYYTGTCDNEDELYSAAAAVIADD